MAEKFTIDGYLVGAEYHGNIARDCVTYRVSVSKVGGGTVGEAYTGDWSVTAKTSRNQMVYNGQTLRVPALKTHNDIAHMVVRLATEGT